MAEETKKPANKALIYAIAAVVIILIIINILVFSGYFKKCTPFRDSCFYGQTANVTSEIGNLVASSSKIVLVAEGDVNATQLTGEVSASFAQLSQDFSARNKELRLLAAGFSNGALVSCTCVDFRDSNFTNCNTSCESVKPSAGELVIYLKYPQFAKNEVFIASDSITIQATDGASLSGMVAVLRGLY